MSNKHKVIPTCSKCGNEKPVLYDSTPREPFQVLITKCCHAEPKPMEVDTE